MADGKKKIVFERFNRSLVFPERQLSLHSMLAGGGYDCIEQGSGYSYDGMKRGNREFAIWQMTLSGLGAVDYDGETRLVPPGHGIFVRVPQMHRYYLPRESDRWEFVYLNFSGRELLRIWREIEKVAGLVIPIEQSPQLAEFTLETVGKLYKNDFKGPFQASSVAYAFICMICETVFSKIQNIGPASGLLREAGEFCMKNLSEKFGVEELAGAMGYSRFHFSRLLRQLYGAPPSKFINDMRLKHALRLLQTEKSSIKEISASCGFCDSNYFCKVFRKEFGISPGRFRKGKR